MAAQIPRRPLASPIKSLLHEYAVIRTNDGNVIGELVRYEEILRGVVVLIVEVEGVRMVVRDWYAIVRYQKRLTFHKHNKRSSPIVH